ncbi:MAG: tryptophan-rich sensory protein [Oscillospiraceae bacterium]|nr:tryptophan-rich sensory protein [Oscillospiraceae bacterium]
MTKKQWKTYLFWILLAEAVGALSGFLSRNGMKQYESTITQPPLSPPGILFPIVWGILYALMGFSVARIRLLPQNDDTRKGTNLFIAQLIVNFFWSLIFFNAQAYGFALIWLVLLWVLVFLMIKVFNKADTPAAGLQIPYLLWLTFAAYLNAGVWYLN